MARGVLLWDFDDTLAHRPGKWGGAMMDALAAWDPTHGVTREAVRDQLQQGFPWHTPEVAHPELDDAEAWWDHMRALLARAFIGAGAPAAQAPALVEDARARYLDPAVDPQELLQDAFINIYRYPDRFDASRPGAFRARPFSVS